VIIDRYGWRGAYISLATLTALGAVVVAKYAPAPDNHTRSTERGAGRLPVTHGHHCSHRRASPPPDSASSW